MSDEQTKTSLYFILYYLAIKEEIDVIEMGANMFDYDVDEYYPEWYQESTRGAIRYLIYELSTEDIINYIGEALQLQMFDN